MKHYHKYRKVDIGNDKTYYVYRCMLPDCKHYISEKLIVSRTSLCWLCDLPFVVTKGKIHKPICELCHNKKFGKTEDQKVEEILKAIGVIK